MRKVNRRSDLCHKAVCLTSILLVNIRSQVGMKKLISIIFTLIYFNTAFGVGVDIHYCGGNIADITIVGLGHAHCNCPAESMPPGCCKNVACFCKTDNHKIPAITAVGNVKYLVHTPIFFPDYISPMLSTNISEPGAFAWNHSTINCDDPDDLFILYKVFRI